MSTKNVFIKVSRYLFRVEEAQNGYNELDEKDQRQAQGKLEKKKKRTKYFISTDRFSVKCLV